MSFFKNLSTKEINLKGLLARKEDSFDVGGNILIDLTPASYREVIELRQHKKRWTYIVFAVMILAAIGLGFSYFKFLSADLALKGVENEQEVIDQQVQEFADINDVLVARDNARVTLESAAGSELDWEKVYQNINSELPSDTSIARLAVNVNENAVSNVAAAVQIDLTAGSTMSYADTLEVITDLKEVSSVTIGGLKSSGEGYTFSMAFTYDPSIKTDRYNYTQQEQQAMEEEMMNHEELFPEDFMDGDQPMPLGMDDLMMDDPMLDNPDVDGAGEDGDMGDDLTMMEELG